MDKKEKSTRGIFCMSVVLSFVFMSLLSFKGCGSDSDGSSRLRPDGICVEKDDFFQCPEASFVLSAFDDAKSEKDFFRAWKRAWFWNFILESAGGNPFSSLKPEHDRIIERLEKKSPPNSLIDLYKRAVPLLFVVFDGKGSSQNDYIAVAGASIQEGVFRKASGEEKAKYKKIGFLFTNVNPQKYDYEDYRLIEDYNYLSNGDLDINNPNGNIFYIEKFPTISLWYKTEEEKNLALKKKKYVTREFPVLLKRSELSNIDSLDEYEAAMEGQKKRLEITFSKDNMLKLKDVPPKEGSNLKELWIHAFLLETKKGIPLAGSIHLVKVHVG